MKKRREQLEGLDREALIEGYLLLEDRVRSLEKQAKALRELLQARAPKTPENSSLPSGQSHKANQQAQPQGKRGAKVGHRGTSRSRSEPDEITECRVRECPSCGEDWSQLAQHVAGRHQVIELPPLQPKVYEVVRYGCTCPRCGQYHRAEAPVGFEAGRVVGTQLERLVLYLCRAHPLSYQRVQRILAEVCGVELSGSSGAPGTGGGDADLGRKCRQKIRLQNGRCQSPIQWTTRESRSMPSGHLFDIRAQRYLDMDQWRDLRARTLV